MLMIFCPGIMNVPTSVAEGAGCESCCLPDEIRWTGGMIHKKNIRSLEVTDLSYIQMKEDRAFLIIKHR